jgi:4-hydroxy-3-methylbut-2-enyl diphosphate reductase IspH
MINEMMKKFLMLIVALVACISINAQTALQTTKVLDNTYIGINAGASTPLSFNSVFQ